MSFSRLLVHDIDVVNPTVTTSRVGDEVLDWGNPTTQRYRGWVDMTSAFEDEQMRDQTVTRALFFLPPDTVIRNDSRLLWDGRTFQATGEPILRYRPSGLHHMEVRAKEVEG